MRATLLALGVVLVLAGGYVVFQGMSVTTNREVLEVGPLSASVEERQRVPTWVGGLAAVAGLVMIIAGAGATKARG